MTTITKEFTKEQLIEQAKKNIEVLRGAVERVPGASDAAVIHLKLAEITLASLEAEPVAYIFKHPAGKLFWALTDESNKEQADVIPVYAAPPVPVVPEEKPMPNALSMLEREITQLIGDAQEATVTGYELIAEAWRLMDGQDPKTSDWHSKASKYLNSNIVEKVDDDRIEAVKAVLRRLAGNSPVIPGEVLSAIMKVARVRADFDDFDGDRRGIGDCLDEAEQELIVTINKYASQLAAEPIAPNDVREQTAIPQVPVTPDGWISCSERTPESIPGSCKEYLVFDALNNKVHHDYWVVPDGDSAPVASFWNHYGAHVTHWMPLPEPPQQDGK
nr:DUF551 domain-containing protein [Escherichia coli]